MAPQDNRCKLKNQQSSLVGHKIRIARTAREHEALMARNMMSNHTDMQDKYCGHRYDIHYIQSQNEEPTQEVARSKAVSPLLWWRPKAATFVYWL